MKKPLTIVLYFIFFSTTSPLFAQIKTPAAKTARKALPARPVQKTKPVVKTKPRPGINIPAKTSPTVTVKTKITAKKTVIKEKLAKLPPGVNKNENANVQPAARELEMIAEINNLRRDPKAYIPFVEKFIRENVKNKEIPVAGKELIKQLKSMQALPELTLNPVMYSAARQFGLSLKDQDEIDHSDLPYYENLSLGHPNIRDAIIDLLVDDGFPDRGHRSNLLNPTISKIAVYEVPGDVQGYSNCYIQVFK